MALLPDFSGRGEPGVALGSVVAQVVGPLFVFGLTVELDEAVSIFAGSNADKRSAGVILHRDALRRGGDLRRAGGSTAGRCASGCRRNDKPVLLAGKGIDRLSISAQEPGLTCIFQLTDADGGNFVSDLESVDR